ncbi:MAG: hypothetical protein JO036_17515 [Candidatus Eremiobacteraeota bacterium]|nr:hypothetical protein [Candidatus Eremiobacteraeota bacterium]
MTYVVQAIPFLLLALLGGLAVASLLRRRIPRERPARAPRLPKKSTLRVTRSQIDEDLAELLRRRSP